MWVLRQPSWYWYSIIKPEVTGSITIPTERIKGLAAHYKFVGIDIWSFQLSTVEARLDHQVENWYTTRYERMKNSKRIREFTTTTVYLMYKSLGCKYSSAFSEVAALHWRYTFKCRDFFRFERSSSLIIKCRLMMVTINNLPPILVSVVICFNNFNSIVVYDSAKKLFNFLKKTKGCSRYNCNTRNNSQNKSLFR